MPTVSLIVPVYKAEQWIDECKASICAQTYKDIEIIFIDDKEGSGAAAARNSGLEKATGEFVAFCDADDYMAPDAIEKLVAAMDGADLACGSFRKFGNFDQIVSHPTQMLDRAQVAQYVMGNLRSPRTNQLLSGCWAKMYRSDLISPFPELTTAEDMAFNFTYIHNWKCKRVKFIEDVVYYNRKRTGSLSTTFDQNDKRGLLGFSNALKYVHTFLSSFYAPSEVDEAIDNSKVYHSMLYFMRICEHTGLPMKEAFMALHA